MNVEPIGRAIVRWLGINRNEVSSLTFDLEGPRGDAHSGFRRKLSGHDTEYMIRYGLPKGTMISNTRMWSGIALEELQETERVLGCDIPFGTLGENFVIESFPGFSRLKPGSQLVFPMRTIGDEMTRAALLTFEENGPCATIGRRLAELYDRPKLILGFVRAAAHKRGQVGTVHVAGLVKLHDEVLIYPPVE